MTIPQINYGPQGYVSGWDYRQMYEQNKENFNVPNEMHPQNEMPRYDRKLKKNRPFIEKAFNDNFLDSRWKNLIFFRIERKD